MNRPAYSGAYSQRRFSNYTADNAPAGESGQTRFNLSVTSGNPTMGEVGLLKLTEESPLSSSSAAQQPGAADRGGYAAGNAFRATAKALDGYRFVQWETNIDGVGNTSRNPLEFKLTKDTWLVARFEKIQGASQQTRTANVGWNGKMGRVSGNGLVLDNEGRANSGVISATQGSSVTLTASPLDGYHFVKWVGAPVDGKTSAKITFPMNANYNITAEFAANDPNPGSGNGNVIGGGGGGGIGTSDTPATVAPTTVKKQESGVMAFVKKWWWAILIVAYIVYKEGGSK